MAREIKYNWVTVGDKSVCPDCADREGYDAATLDEWAGLGEPRIANTACDGRCRCALIPSTIEDIEIEGKRLIETELKRDIVRADLSVGRQVLLRDFEKYEDILTLSYNKIAELEGYILQWKIDNNFKKLPDEFLKLTRLSEMLRFIKPSDTEV